MWNHGSDTVEIEASGPQDRNLERLRHYISQIPEASSLSLIGNAVFSIPVFVTKPKEPGHRVCLLCSVYKRFALARQG